MIALQIMHNAWLFQSLFDQMTSIPSFCTLGQFVILWLQRYILHMTQAFFPFSKRTQLKLFKRLEVQAPWRRKILNIFLFCVFDRISYLGSIISPLCFSPLGWKFHYWSHGCYRRSWETAIPSPVMCCPTLVNVLDVLLLSTRTSSQCVC